MHLLSLKYSEHLGESQEWSISGLSLTSKNLIVGKNASGKSRTLNIIYGLARSIAGLQGATKSGKYEVIFSDNMKEYKYTVDSKNEEVVYEQLIIDNKVFLDRKAGGKGEIIAEKINPDSPIEFHTPPSSYAVFSRRDEIQHSYLEPLFKWASSVRHYPFSTYLGKDLFAIIVPNGPKADDRDHQAVIGLFREAKKQFGDSFIEALINDLSIVDYHIENIDVASPVSVQIYGLPGEPIGLYVKEKNLPGITDQHSMSVGMFRVLSLLIHINYSQFMKSASTIIVDDIGEGLDFDRSCKLIGLLRSKADDETLQLILSTNDKFVMNNVPLEEWSVLVRKGNHVEVKNYSNSKEKFDDFKFTGLNNFSFLELDVINDN